MNAHITAIIEFLRFCARVGLVESTVVDRFVEVKHLRFLPEGMPRREDGSHRVVTAKVTRPGKLPARSPREDLHFLPDSRALGCAVVGAHLRVRRWVNDNNALAKNHYPRGVPVGRSWTPIATTQYERDRLVPRSRSDFVFVNLYAATDRDSAMKYQNTRNCLRRIAKRAGVEARLHMLRHTAGTVPPRPTTTPTS